MRSYRVVPVLRARGQPEQRWSAPWTGLNEKVTYQMIALGNGSVIIKAVVERGTIGALTPQLRLAPDRYEPGGEHRWGAHSVKTKRYGAVGGVNLPALGRLLLPQLS